MISSVEEAVKDIAAGKIVIVVDDEDRENEGDFVMAAEKVTPEAINFMAKHGRGLICLSSRRSRLDELGLKMMSESNSSRFGTAFMESIDFVRYRLEYSNVGFMKSILKLPSSFQEIA